MALFKNCPSLAMPNPRRGATMVIPSVVQGNEGDEDSTVARQFNPDFCSQTGQASPSSWQRWLETILIFVCFATFAGQLPPDINESHYLTKAKHFWNPDWLAGDIFLGSSFSHWLFHLTAGWLTQFCSLSTVAWIGRIVTWSLLAFGWQQLSWKVLAVRWLAVVSALCFLLLNNQFHLAGEWVVGGFEAKGLAYFFVLLALGSMIQRDWNRVWPLLGLAMAFHVLVGGWSLLAAIIVGFGLNWQLVKDSLRFTNMQVSRLPSASLPFFAGIAIGMIGVIPPLLADISTDSETAAAAHTIYVNHRISHHLTFGAFPTLHVARFVLIAVFGYLLNQWLKHHWSPMHRRLGPIFLFGLASLLFSFGGLLLSGIAEQNDRLAGDCASLLRFYWFRLSDFAVPAWAAISSCSIIWFWLGTDRRLRTRISCLLFIACIVVTSLFLIMKEHGDPRPRADRRASISFDADPIRAVETFQNWKKVCHWISENTPDGANFITPADQQTFKWYAKRPEVVCWKDIPQDANGILEWRKRLIDLYEPQRRYPNGLMEFSDQQLRELANRYGATHLLVPQRQVDSAAPTSLKQVYPEDPNIRSTFVVFEF